MKNQNTSIRILASIATAAILIPSSAFGYTVMGSSCEGVYGANVSQVAQGITNNGSGTSYVTCPMQTLGRPDLHSSSIAEFVTWGTVTGPNMDQGRCWLGGHISNTSIKWASLSSGFSGSGFLFGRFGRQFEDNKTFQVYCGIPAGGAIFTIEIGMGS